MTYNEIKYINSQFARDYLGIQDNPKNIATIERNNEGNTRFWCFSDTVYKINHKDRREKRALFITSNQMKY